MRRLFGTLAAMFLIASTTPSVSAEIILQNTGGTAGTLTEFFGSSFTTPTGGPFDNITFNFYANIPATTPSAAGTAFLLTKEYLGSASALSTSTAGFLAESTGISGGEFVFASSVVLQANTQYFLYGNAALTSSGGNTFPGSAAYFANSSTDNFAMATVPGTNNPQASNFLLGGTTMATVPEPSSIVITGIGLLASLGAWRRSRRSTRVSVVRA